MATCKRFTFDVAGATAFPVDMLRYDQCWPTTTEGALEVARGPRKPVGDPDEGKLDGRYFKARSVNLASHSTPTPARWASFGWTVLAIPVGEKL